MYKCFESIPLTVRQAAFDRFRESGEQDYGKFIPPTSTHLEFTIGDNVCVRSADCCPWGAINYILLEQNRDITPDNLEHRVLSHEIRMPDNGTDERQFLKNFNLKTNSRSVNHFINRNDGPGFGSYRELAEAMGVEYKPE